jgi:hypothetical protein
MTADPDHPAPAGGESERSPTYWEGWWACAALKDNTAPYREGYLARDQLTRDRHDHH